MWLFAAFLLIPLIEIALFIQVGGLIGLWPTLLIVVATAVLGTAMVRQQGGAVMAQLRGAMSNLSDPSEPLAHGAMVLFSGALLLTPGFFTDALGFALLIPGVRTRVFAEVRKRVRVQTMTYGTHPQAPQDDSVIDAEFTEVPLGTHRPDGPPSGWTRH